MKWQRQTILGRCDSTSCTSPEIIPGEPVRLVVNGLKRWCKTCAKVRLFEDPPADMPEQDRPKKFSAKEFTTFDRAAAGGELRKNILTRRQLEQVNANDPKLKQAGDR